MSIQVINVSKTFVDGKNRVEALKDISFEVKKGEIMGFVGANGAGKSTCMRIIMGVLNSDSGQVKLFDKTANKELRRKVGYMPAERGLYSKMKILDQLVFFAKLRGLGSKDAKEKAEKWIELLELKEHANKNLEALSTGNQQRAQLATALVTEPEILVLDEPFSGLDPVAVKNLTQIIKDQASKGVTVLFSSHQLDLVDRIADTITIIKKGQILASDNQVNLRKFASEKYGTPLEIKVPTPLVDIFEDLISEDK